MQIRDLLLLVSIALGIVTTSYAQPKNYDIKNNFMVGGGLSYFDMISDNFETERGSGWLISAGIGAHLPHKWYDISYNIQLTKNNFEITGRETSMATDTTPIEYDIFAAQAGLVFHINIIGGNFTIDLGPQLQYNSDLEVSSSQAEDYFITGHDNLRAEDITNINNFNLNGMGGVTVGFGNFKVRAQYIYGLLNSFDKLSDLDTFGSSDFKGNPTFMTLAAFIAF